MKNNIKRTAFSLLVKCLCVPAVLGCIPAAAQTQAPGDVFYPLINGKNIIGGFTVNCTAPYIEVRFDSMNNDNTKDPFSQRCVDFKVDPTTGRVTKEVYFSQLDQNTSAVKHIPLSLVKLEGISPEDFRKKICTKEGKPKFDKGLVPFFRQYGLQ